MGFDPPEEICQRHGVVPDEFDKLQHYGPFTDACVKAAADFAERGITLELKAKLAMEKMLDSAIQIANDTAAEPKDRMDAMNFVAKVAKADAVQDAQGKGASISISIPSHGGPPRLESNDPVAYVE